MTATCDICDREFDTEHGLSVHKTAAHEKEKPYTDAERLRRLYWGEGLSMDQVAERLGTEKDRIDYWMGVHDIDTRRAYAEQDFASLRVDKDGYRRWRVYHDGDYHGVAVHRLAAVAEYGFSRVAGRDVHHKNGVPWDNRPANLEPMDPSEHRRLHGVERADEQRELMCELRDSGALAGGDDE